jgi:hypothetical protein
MPKRSIWLGLKKVRAQRMFVDAADGGNPRLVAAKCRRKEFRLTEKSRSAPIGVGIAPQIARQQTLEGVDGNVSSSELVVEAKHLDEQARAQPEWRTRGRFRNFPSRRFQ